VDLEGENGLPDRLAKLGCGVLVLSRDSALFANGREQTVLERLRCPVLAVH
jgi:hypothetical protein